MASFALMTLTCPSPRSACICARITRLFSPLCRPLNWTSAPRLAGNGTIRHLSSAHTREEDLLCNTLCSAPHIKARRAHRRCNAERNPAQRTDTSKGLTGAAYPYLTQDVWRHHTWNGTPNELDGHQALIVAPCKGQPRAQLDPPPSSAHTVAQAAASQAQHSSNPLRRGRQRVAAEWQQQMGHTCGRRQRLVEPGVTSAAPS